MERRRFVRYQQAVNALCQFQGELFKAITQDLSPEGLTIMTTQEVPVGSTFHIKCSLDNGSTTLFEVEERQRRYIQRGSLRYLRLGLHIREAAPNSSLFFRELARLVQSRQPRRSDDSEPRKKSRVHNRIQFQLPVRISVHEQVYKCQTFDIGTRGLSLLVPPDLPDHEVFEIVIEDPQGGLIPLKIRSVYREMIIAPRSGFRIGAKAIVGSAAYHQFLKRHGLIGRPPL